jgi:hypothetical protein
MVSAHMHSLNFSAVSGYFQPRSSACISVTCAYKLHQYYQRRYTHHACVCWHVHACDSCVCMPCTTQREQLCQTLGGHFNVAGTTITSQATPTHAFTRAQESKYHEAKRYMYTLQTLCVSKFTPLRACCRCIWKELRSKANIHVHVITDAFVLLRTHARTHARTNTHKQTRARAREWAEVHLPCADRGPCSLAGSSSHRRRRLTSTCRPRT